MARKGGAMAINGFDELISRIQKAGGTIDQAADACARKAAEVQQAHLKAQMQRVKADPGLVASMPEPEIERNGNAWFVHVGYKKGDYDPKNLTEGYKAVFLNYGTPRVKPRRFVAAAKKKARSAIKKAEEETLETMLKGLSK